MKIAELTEELDKQMELNLALRTEVDTLKEQSEIDNAIIESLRSLAMSVSRRGASSTPAKNASFVEIGVQTLAVNGSESACAQPCPYKGHVVCCDSQCTTLLSPSESLARSKLVLARKPYPKTKSTQRSWQVCRR